MKARLYQLLPLLITVLLLFACKSSTVLDDFQLDMGYNYFPLEIGKYREYTVDSILYDTTGMGIVIEQTQTLVREEVVDTFRDNTNRLTYKIERFVRRTELDAWEVQTVSYAVATDDQLELVEDNLRFIKMVFPLADGELWDGNQFIDPTTTITIKGELIEIFKSWSYEVSSIDEVDVIDDVTYDSVATIIQAESENVIELRLSTEKYARGIGLIYREMKILDTQCIAGCEGKSWEEKAQKGFILRQVLTGYN